MRTIDNQHIAIIGAARSGVGAARLCKHFGGYPFVSDSGSTLFGSMYEEKLKEYGIPYELGEHSEKLFDSDVLVLSPGVPSTAPAVQKAYESGVHVVSELEFASWFFDGRIVAVTGSNGKTTTTSIISEIFKVSGLPYFTAGNIGYAFSEGIVENPNAKYAVLEVSSFQLDYIDTFKPDVAVITNISPDHLDRYDGSYEKYIQAKRRIFQNQTKTDYLVVNYDDPNSSEYSHGAHSQIVGCSVTEILPRGGWVQNSNLVVGLDESASVTITQTDAIKVKGAHNLMNMVQASVAAVLFEVETDSIRTGTTRFTGVEHRIEFVRNLNGVNWYNDSKATNVDSTITALKSFDANIVLIAGGKDKGAPYEPLRPYVADKVRVLIVMGEAASKINAALKDVAQVLFATSFSDAVALAASHSEPGDVVLLSPACASFDMFSNYEHRGVEFKNEVMFLK